MPHALMREYGEGEKRLPETIAVPATVSWSPVRIPLEARFREGCRAMTASQETCLQSRIATAGVCREASLDCAACDTCPCI